MSTYAYRLLQGINFSDKRILEVLPRLTIRSYEQGDVIWAKGSRVQSWNCVMTGYVAATIPLDQGGRMPVHIYGHHAWFGEQPLLNKQPSHLEYTCLTPVEVIGMGQKCLDDAIRDEPDFVRFLVSLVSCRVQQHSEMLMLMRLGSSLLRVVMGLAQFAEALNLNGDHRPVEEQQASVDIRISQEVIAALCGVSRTLFSEYIQHLARAGWIKVRYGAIELQFPETWRNFVRNQRERPRVVSRPTVENLLAEMLRTHQELAIHDISNTKKSLRSLNDA